MEILNTINFSEDVYFYFSTIDKSVVEINNFFQCTCVQFVNRNYLYFFVSLFIK